MAQQPLRRDVATEVRKNIKGIDGWLTPAEATWLACHAQGKMVLELGSYMGRSAVAMLPYAEHIYCVDHFYPKSAGQGYNPRSEGVLADFLENTKPWRHKVAYYQVMTFMALSIDWPPIDLLFVDAGHKYLEVMHDLEFVRFLTPGGIVAVHDTEKPGPSMAVDRSIMTYYGWEEIQGVHTIRAFVTP